MTYRPLPVPDPAGPLRAGSLCTGYGLDLAVTAVLDTGLAWYAEPDPHAAGVRAVRWPGPPNLGDLTTVDWATVPPVDLITAGWPCQDISLAGQGAGITEGTRSGRWLHIASCLLQLRPDFAYLENVAALRTRGLARVLADLAALGYDTQWATLRACDTGAPHRRARLFVLAVRPGCAGRLLAVAHPAATDHDGSHDLQAGGRRPSDARRQVGLSAMIALTACPPQLPGGTRRGPLLPTPDTGISPNGHGRRGGRPGNGHESGSSLDAVIRTLTQAAGHASAARGDPGIAVQWAGYEPAIRRWEQITGRPAPPPAEPGPRGRPVLNPGFCEWLMGLPEGWVCGVPGLSRTIRLRTLGNGVVPRQGAAALRLLIGTAARIPGVPQPSRPGCHHVRTAA